MADPTQEQDPKNFVFQFFRTLMMSQCSVSFSMLTNESQKVFIEHVMKDMYERRPAAAKGANIGPKEVRMLIENNDSGIMKTFWRTFYQTSRCYDMIYNGIYRTEHETPQTATVVVQLPQPNDAKLDVPFTAHRKGPVWKLAYVESKAPL
jgi:hypothetical protein